MMPVGLPKFDWLDNHCTVSNANLAGDNRVENTFKLRGAVVGRFEESTCCAISPCSTKR